MDGEWQAELTQSGSRLLQGISIPAAAVSRAAAELHEDISKAIESVLDAAREQHQARLAELEAELDQVKAKLAAQAAAVLGAIVHHWLGNQAILALGLAAGAMAVAALAALTIPEA